MKMLQHIQQEIFVSGMWMGSTVFSFETIIYGAQAIELRKAGIVLFGGNESTSRSPW